MMLAMMFPEALRANGPAAKAPMSEQTARPALKVALCARALESDIGVRVKLCEERRLLIGELAERAGVSVRSLRYYEEQGLLTPTRRPSGYRDFTEADVVQVRRIQQLLSAGLGTVKIRRILPCLKQHADGVALSCGQMYGELTAERDEIVQKLAMLRASLEALDEVIQASPPPE